MQTLSVFAQTYARQTQGNLDTLTYTGAEFDSRRLKPGQLFFALSGQRCDGHDFLQQVADSGAVAAVVSRFCSVDIPQILVDDPEACFIASAHDVRARWQDKTVIAITGSMGKTSSKDLLSSVCRLHKNTFATLGNYNNLLGVSWCIHNVPESAYYVVLELGISEPGEMTLLAALAKPDIAWVTTIAPCHLDGLRNCDEIAFEKAQIYQALSASGIAVINDKDDYVTVFNAHSMHCQRLNLYSDGSELSEDSIRMDALARCQFSARIAGQPVSLQLSLVGRHQVFNAYGVAVIAHALGVPMPHIVDGLCQHGGTDGRAKAYHLSAVEALLIDDSYNANPQAMYSAIQSVASVAKPVKCLVFGDMLELADTSEDWHRKIGVWANEHGIDFVLTLGTQAHLALSTYHGHGKAFTDQVDLVNYVRSIISADMVILVKGSRGSGLDRTVRALLECSVLNP